MTVSTPGRVGGTFLTGWFRSSDKQHYRQMDRRGRMLKLSLLLIFGSITQALNTPNCTDLPKQQKAIPQRGMAAFKAEADLRGKLQQRWHQT